MGNGGNGGCANGRGGRGGGGGAGGGLIFGGKGGKGGYGRDDAENDDENIDDNNVNGQVEPETGTNAEPVRRGPREENYPIQEVSDEPQNSES